MSEAPLGQKDLSSILVKPAGPDCSLACGYCFYLNKSSLFPTAGGHRMDNAVAETLVRQVMSLPSPHLSFGWQGGEPTLMGLPFFERVTEHQIRYGRGQRVANSIQTNGLTVDERWAQFFVRRNYLVGVSLDGPAHIHDRYRRTPSGSGTWQRVTDCVRRLLGSGVAVNALSVVTEYAAQFPSEIYGFLKESGLSYQQYIPCEVDGVGGGDSGLSVSADAYGAFLIALFDLWRADFEDGMPTVSVRFFESLLNRFLGAPPSDCTLEKTCGVYLTVEHNGDVFPCDFYVDAAHRLGNVTTDSLSSLFRSDAMRRFGEAKAVLPETCRVCEFVSLCRGACPKERPSHGAAPSRLCSGYRAFFSHASPLLKEMAGDILARQQRRDAAELIRSAHPRLGRNESCPCGSGRKYKACCLRID